MIGTAMHDTPTTSAFASATKVYKWNARKTFLYILQQEGIGRLPRCFGR